MTSSNAININVCVGNCCYSCEAVSIFEELQNYVNNKNLTDSIKITPVLCLDNCDSAVNIKINNELIPNVNKLNLYEIIDNYVCGDKRKDI